jgi:hypothetical protein
VQQKIYGEINILAASRAQFMVELSFNGQCTTENSLLHVFQEEICLLELQLGDLHIDFHIECRAGLLLA